MVAAIIPRDVPMSLNPPEPAPSATPLAAYSRFYQRLQRRYAAQLHLLAPGVPTRQSLEATCQTLLQSGHSLAVALRILRQLLLERLISLDCDGRAALADITLPITALAELALDLACTQARAELDARHGPALAADGQPAALWVIGMGKLGGRELNVSSDIDLIYIYEQDGETLGVGAERGRGRISHHEYFAKAVKIIHSLVGEATDHGQVFRIDLALRPHGNSGPSALSLVALEEYLQIHGREWERFAWLKSRVIAPRTCVSDPKVQSLRAVVLPFVFRRYLDYNVFESLRGLHQQIRNHATQRSAGRPERANDVKLSRGGIREIEFTVQLLQVVRGGQYPELRCRPTLEALQRLTRAGLMAPDKAQALAEAYTFLRRVEHRIQYLDDQQTHVLPTRDDDLAWMAQSLGLSSCDFLRQLDSHRELVAQEFDTLLGASESGGCKSGKCNKTTGAANPAHAPQLETLLQELPPSLAERLSHWSEQPRVQALRPEARARLLRILQRAGRWLANADVSELAVLRLLDWIEPLLRRESYLALLQERPLAQRHLLDLLGAAKWPVRYLTQHPGVIDELASEALLTRRFDSAVFEQDLQRRRAALQSTGEDDDETLLDLLRRAHHADTFRTLARDVGARISVEEVADDLSALADSVLRVTAQWCWQRLRQRHREQPQFAIIGYGKLGGIELGYGSDLDIVFVFDDEDERAPEIYAAFARKLINWLTVKTGEGDLFEIDTELRPNGNSGLLVTSFASYADYQQQRGSNTAWTWEHQAMTRARFVLGSPDLRQRFDAVRLAVITAPRERAALRTEILAMRERLYAAHPAPAELFDIKHSHGGMLDAEFAVQYLVLAHSAEHLGLRDNKGNIALLQRAEAAGLLAAPIGTNAAKAYRSLRHAQHYARLNEAPTRVPPAELAVECDAIVALWQAVFSDPI